AGIVAGVAAKRELVRVSGVTSQAALRGDVEAFELIGQIRGSLDSLEAEAAPDDATLSTAPDAAMRAYEAMQEMAQNGRARGLMTGLRCVDRRLGGLRPGALIVIGGRPSMGKTALARAVAHGAAVKNPDRLVAFLGIEMSPEEMMQRELSALTYEDGEGVEYREMGSGKLTGIDLANVNRAARRVPRNLLLDDCASLSLEDVR